MYQADWRWQWQFIFGWTFPESPGDLVIEDIFILGVELDLELFFVTN